MPPPIPQLFKDRYSQIVDDPEAFFACLATMPPKSFRVNTLKSSIDEVKTRFDAYGLGIRQAPWYEQAFISESLEAGSTLEHFRGMIYMQELASMLPPLVLREELSSARIVLDACAAPGSKTTQMAAFMANRGVIIANDVDYSRIRALKFNIEKTGAVNTVITNQSLLHFPAMRFDVVLVDAPCSAEGTLRKSDSALALWSERHIQGLARLQKQLAVKGFDLLAPGGSMVYSTCTFAPEEDEAVVQYLLDERKEAEVQDLSVPGFRLTKALEGWAGEQFDSQVKKAARVWPHHNDTDGFFLAKIRKPEAVR